MTILECCVGVSSLLPQLQLILPCSASLLGLNLIAAPVGQSNCSYSAFHLLATCRQAARIPAFCVACFLVTNPNPGVPSRDQRDFVPSLRNCSPLSKSFGQSSAETILFQLPFPRTLPCLLYFVSRLKRALDLPMQ